MIERNDYIEYIRSFIDKPQVKILTGIRRCGKSTILQMLKNELLSSEIENDRIILLNFESFTVAHLTNSMSLYNYLKEKLKNLERHYLLFDEIQEVENWEKLINSLLVDFNVDIYITGSNSHLLSSEFSTYLAGRYVNIPIYTLSFSEFIDFRKHYFEQKPSDDFTQYLRLGGFPVIHTTDYSQESAYKVIFDIYSSVILRDTVQRNKIRDIELLERVVKYAFNNVGNTFSGKSVADYFKSQNRKIDVNTVYNYLYALESAFVLYRVPRFDIKGKEILKTQEKFFVSDISLIYSLMGYNDAMISGILENLVFLEMKRRGFNVFVGKIDNRKIDFICEKQNEKIYLQCAYKLDGEQTVEREFSPLLAINDNYPKFVITMDEFWQGEINGVKHVHIADFLKR